MNLYFKANLKKLIIPTGKIYWKLIRHKMIKWKRRLINFPQLVQRSDVFDQKLDVPTLLSVFSYPSNDVQRSEVFDQKTWCSYTSEWSNPSF